jgi:very-short-patch-repair endonuclease
MRSQATPAEALLWESLRNRKLGGFKFRRQQPMFGFVADFYCEACDLCVEVDGAVHQSMDAQAADKERDSAMAGAGILTLRFSNEMVLKRLPLVLSRIQDELERRSVARLQSGS